LDLRNFGETIPADVSGLIDALARDAYGPASGVVGFATVVQVWQIFHICVWLTTLTNPLWYLRRVVMRVADAIVKYALIFSGQAKQTLPKSAFAPPGITPFQNWS
jgi:hypothetical protein